MKSHSLRQVSGISLEPLDLLLSVCKVKDYKEINNNGTLVCGSSTMFKVDDFTRDMSREEMVKYNINRIKEALGCERQ